MKGKILIFLLSFVLLSCSKEEDKTTAQVKIWIENNNPTCIGIVAVYPDDWSRLIETPYYLLSFKDTIQYEPETCWDNKPKRVITRREFIMEVEAGQNLDILVTDSCRFEKKLAITAVAGEVYTIPIR